jgi:hypothetical protein
VSGEARRSRHVVLTLPDPILAALDRIATEDAARMGRDPSRERSATVGRLVVAERARREKRSDRKKAT